MVLKRDPLDLELYEVVPMSDVRDVAQWLQDLADRAPGAAPAALFNGSLLIASTGGSASNLVDGFYQHAPSPIYSGVSYRAEAPF